MKFKRLTALFLALVILFSFAGCKNDLPDNSDVSSEIIETETVSPLLYKVTDNSGNTVWLFGSIHIGRENFYPLPSYITEAFESADSLAVEFDIVAYKKELESNMSLQMEYLNRYAYTDGSTIDEHISYDLYWDAVKILEDNGLYFSYIDSYKPTLWASMIDSLSYEKIHADFDNGVDLHLINMAYEQEKEVLDVESAEFQESMFANFSSPLQEYLLEISIASYYNPSDDKAETELLLDAWAKGDEKEIAEILNETYEFETNKERILYGEYNKALTIDRNLSMTDYAENALLSGKEVFICVGTAHVVGEGAMAQMLRDRGYTVEIVR